MALGWPSVEWGLNHISSAELTDWIAYEQEFGPLGAQRNDQLAALITASMMNGFAAFSGSDQRFTAEDFLVVWSDRQRKEAVRREASGEYRRHPNMKDFEEMAAAMGWTEE